MGIKFEDNHIKIKNKMNSELVAFLYEAAGELQSEVQRNSAVGKVGGGQTKGSWKYTVDKQELVATIGSDRENAIWEEFGTGEYAVGGNGRKGKWYIAVGNGANQISEAVVEAYGMSVVHGKDGKKYVCTNGKKPKRTFQKAYEKKKNGIQKQLERILKGLGV